MTSKQAKSALSVRTFVLWVAVPLVGAAFAACSIDSGTDSKDAEEAVESAPLPINAASLAQNTDGCSLNLPTQTLAQYATDCQEKVGGLVLKDSSTWFDCDDGSPVDEGNDNGWPWPTSLCDRPNVLRDQCDKDSKFQVLKSLNPNVLMVAHCRKMGRGLTNAWGDIAVIEYNTLSGNTCFFQSPVPGPMQPALTGKVPPPSNPTQTFWQTPSTTASQNCVSCHDSGPFIRDPYLSHLKLDPDAVAKGNVVPGSRTPHIWNETMPYRFVGNDFQSWKTFSIKASASSSTCADCHRMAISARNGLFTANAGTSGAFALTATTANGQSTKNPGAPMWMFMDQASVPHNQTTQDEAQVYKTCADSIINGTSTPYACAYSEFGRGDSCTGPLDGGVVNGSISGDDPSFHYSSQTPTVFGPGTAGPGIRGFMYWETLHGPFWQTTPSTVPVGSANYRGSYLRVVVDANGFYAKAAYSDSHGLVEKAAPGGTLKGVAFSEFVTNPVSPSACTLGLAPLTDTDGTHTTSAVLIGSPNMYPETLTGLIGNVAQTVTPRADFLRVFSGSNTVVTQTHALVTSGPLKSGFLQGESYTATCPSWPLTYLARNVLSTNDVVILANPAPKVARCFISGISGSWSSSRVNGAQHSEPYAAIYRDTNGAYHLKVGPDDLGSPPAADRVGAYASCIQL